MGRLGWARRHSLGIWVGVGLINEKGPEKREKGKERPQTAKGGKALIISEDCRVGDNAEVIYAWTA